MAGVVAYAGVLMAALLVGRRSGAVDATGWRLLELLTPIVLGAAVWFLALQATGAAPPCAFCLAIHACGVAAAALAIVARRAASRRSANGPAAPMVPIGEGRRAPSRLPPPPLGVPTLGGIAAAAALAVGQVMFPPQMNVIDAASLSGDFSLEADPPAAAGRTLAMVASGNAPSAGDTNPDAGRPLGSDIQPQASRPTRRRDATRQVALLGGKMKIDPYQFPLLGSPEAEHVIVELMNYACGSCRRVGPLLEEARDRYRDQIAVVVLPVPNEILCNRHVKRAIPSARGVCKLSELAVAVAEVAPADFERLHHFLLGRKHLPPFTRANLFARETVDGERLSNALRGDTPKRRVQQFIELYTRLSAKGGLKLPSQIVGDDILEGAPSSVDELCMAWEARLELTPVGGAR